MNSKKVFFGMIGLTILLAALFAAGAYQANKLLHSEGEILLNLKLADAVLDKRDSALLQAKKDISEYSSLEEVTKSIVPQEKDQASTIAEVSQMARESGIALGSIEFPSSELGQISNKKGAKIPDQNKTQLTELSDLKGVYAMKITINSLQNRPVRYEQIISYLKLLESSRRTAQVTDITIQPNTGNSNLFDFSIVLNTYVRPE